MHFNAITLIGTATANPELRFFESGAVRARTTLTVEISKLDLPGELATPDGQAPNTDLSVEVETWGRRAQLMADSIRSGHTFGVSGRLLLAGSGNPRVLADHITFP